MEQFITEIESYAEHAGVTPQRLLRDVLGANWGQWEKWKCGSASPTMKVVDRMRAFMADNPPGKTSGAAA